MRTILFSSLKGGVGKSTLAVTLCQYLTHKKVKSLLIDLDPQADATFLSGAVSTEDNSTVELLRGKKVKPQKVKLGFDVVPGRFDLATFKTEQGSALLLRNNMAQYEGKYDVVVLDSPPTISELLYCGLCAVDEIIIPTKASAVDLNSISGMFDLLDVFKQANPKLKVDGVIINTYSPRTLLAKKVYELTEQEAKKYNVPLLGTIREATSVRESGLFRTSLFGLINNKATNDFIRVFEALDL